MNRTALSMQSAITRGYPSDRVRIGCSINSSRQFPASVLIDNSNKQHTNAMIVMLIKLSTMGGYIVPEASYSAITSDARSGRALMAEPQVTF